uniref:Polycystin cation channel PKD1/PKD2 domain-containing protein n=1 Tax=Chromera velia CCMP2878 TaxID=1169474 RepID=A0A0G4H733_9ALVE|eukprot:Cvel_24964.t1-p1 / transcript=Cvel_24964.t1 / gene=Cvel_24964 / organism=Chromera_velia_CCMP2878 / gene_product=hypothetical protein / transcript_product=hypothetical protein / location=Cvel_scaffold2764:13436-23395(-) / protein_length=1020 / sequence_SO=supercontig / SO=protein_coding / is_pseudo=false
MVLGRRRTAARPGSSDLGKSALGSSVVTACRETLLQRDNLALRLKLESQMNSSLGKGSAFLLFFVVFVLSLVIDDNYESLSQVQQSLRAKFQASRVAEISGYPDLWAYLDDFTTTSQKFSPFLFLAPEYTAFGGRSAGLTGEVVSCLPTDDDQCKALKDALLTTEDLETGSSCPLVYWRVGSCKYTPIDAPADKADAGVVLERVEPYLSSIAIPLVPVAFQSRSPLKACNGLSEEFAGVAQDPPGIPLKAGATASVTYKDGGEAFFECVDRTDSQNTDDTEFAGTTKLTIGVLVLGLQSDRLLGVFLIDSTVENTSMLWFSMKIAIGSLAVIGICWNSRTIWSEVMEVEEAHAEGRNFRLPSRSRRSCLLCNGNLALPEWRQWTGELEKHARTGGGGFGDDMWHFVIIFGILFFCLAFLATWAFGPMGYSSFETFETASMTQSMMLIGDWPWPEGNGSHLLLGLYLFTFGFVVFFVLVNFFLAIVVDAFQVIKDQIRECEVEASFLADILDAALSAIYRKWYALPRISDLEHHLNLAEAEMGEDPVSFQELRQSYVLQLDDRKTSLLMWLYSKKIGGRLVYDNLEEGLLGPAVADLRGKASSSADLEASHMHGACPQLYLEKSGGPLGGVPSSGGMGCAIPNARRRLSRAYSVLSHSDPNCLPFLPMLPRRGTGLRFMPWINESAVVKFERRFTQQLSRDRLGSVQFGSRSNFFGAKSVHSSQAYRAAYQRGGAGGLQESGNSDQEGGGRIREGASSGGWDGRYAQASEGCVRWDGGMTEGDDKNRGPSPLSMQINGGSGLSPGPSTVLNRSANQGQREGEAENRETALCPVSVASSSQEGTNQRPPNGSPLITSFVSALPVAEATRERHEDGGGSPHEGGGDSSSDPTQLVRLLTEMGNQRRRSRDLIEKIRREQSDASSSASDATAAEDLGGRRSKGAGRDGSGGTERQRTRDNVQSREAEGVGSRSGPHPSRDVGVGAKDGPRTGTGNPKRAGGKEKGEREGTREGERKGSGDPQGS